MFHVDLKYLMLLSPQLDRFADKGNHLYNCRCPICGDSEKNKIKARGYFYEVPKGIAYKCHNCTYNSSFWKLIREINPVLFHQYSLERFREGTDYAEPTGKFQSTESKFNKLNLVNLLNCNNEVRDYANTRGFADVQLRRTYYCENFGKWAVDNFGEKYAKLQDVPRLVLPFFDIHGNLVGAQGRSVDPTSKYRYETVKHPDVDSMLFGLDTWNRNLKTKVVEGPIDSLFLNNGLASASSDLCRLIKILPSLDTNTTTFIWDNEPRSKEIVKLMHGCIENDRNIFIWPNELTCKDINDAVKLGYDVNRIIDDNTYSGLSAQLKFSEWRKV